jgi:two-component system OmpR family response regulator
MDCTPLIVVLEDDPEFRSTLAGLLRREGFQVVVCDGAAALDRVVERRRVDLVVLDLMLAREDGPSICRRLRATPTRLPVLATTRGEDIRDIDGLTAGADDYLPQPFHLLELVARARAILHRTRDRRRAPTAWPAERYRFAGWTLHADRRELIGPDGRAVTLTGGEFDMLMVFLLHPQRVLNRGQLLEWARGRSAGPFDRTVDVQLSRLRRKLGDEPRSPSMIKTVRGGGYLFAQAVVREQA